MGINRDSRRPAVTENWGCEKAHQGKLALVSLQWVGVRTLVSHLRWHTELTLWCHRFFLVSKSFLKNLKLWGFWWCLLASLFVCLFVFSLAPNFHGTVFSLVGPPGYDDCWRTKLEGKAPQKHILLSKRADYVVQWVRCRAISGTWQGLEGPCLGLRSRKELRFGDAGVRFPRRVFLDMRSGGKCAAWLTNSSKVIFTYVKSCPVERQSS